MPFIDLAAGGQLYYAEDNASAKLSVLLLHGLGANGSSWKLQIPALVGAGYRVITPDSPGFGKSPYFGQNTSIRNMARPIVDLINHLKLEEMVLVGISMGGTQALQLCVDYPQSFNKLVLVNTFPRLKMASPKLWPYLIYRFILIQIGGLPAQAQAVAERLFPDENQKELQESIIQQIIQSDVKGYRAAMRSLAKFNLTNQLHQIQIPTLIITGKKDTTVLPENQKLLVQGINNSKQIIIPDAGHAVSVERPNIFNQTLLEFLNS